ncbi:MAG TPA: MG2 domain-containing protein [Smithella sp.]|nr:MG2 domain-containing protein [Smithella sp.]
MKSKILWLFFCLLMASAAFAENGARIEWFSPQGVVKDVRQVSVRFSDQMVPFGDPRSLADPFEITCPEKSSSRWADGRNWILDYDRDLPAGISCEFRLKDDVKTLAGRPLDGPKIFTFNTGGPSIRRGSMPGDGSMYIDEEQIFILALDCEPDLDSVKQHVFFSVDGIENNIGIRIIEGKTRQDILKSRGRYAFWLREKHMGSIVLIQSLQRFPSSAKISLIWGKDVKAKSGLTNQQDQILHFQTREPFSAKFTCSRENSSAGCIPFSDMNIYFTAPISRAQAAKIVLKSVNNKLSKQAQGKDAAVTALVVSKKGGKISYHIWKSHLEAEGDDVSSIRFSGPFPEKTDFIVSLPAGLKDNAGRLLVNADKFPLSVRTNEYPPLAKFSSRFGILELKANAGLPVTLRNLEPLIKAKYQRIDQKQNAAEQISGKILNARQDRAEHLQEWLRKVARASREESVFGDNPNIKKFTLPKPHGGKAFEVVGIPMKKSGLYIVELESSILGKELLASSAPMYVPTAVLVTNLSAHFKWGRESSLVWVTTLDEGKPVKDAAVAIRDCQEKIIWQGRTDLSGIARVNTQLPSDTELPNCYDKDEDHRYYYSESGPLGGLQSGLFVTAQTKDDLTFVHSSWDEGIEPWRFQLPADKSGSNIYGAHTIFDRTLLRAGEKISMKHVFRKRNMSGFGIPPQDTLPNNVLITHSGSDEKYEFPLRWSANGTAETTWQIPKDAKLGTYEVTLTNKDEDDKATKVKVRKTRRIKKARKRLEGSFETGEFRVEEFRVPLMKGTIQPPEAPLVNAQKVDLKLGVQYLAGGGAGLIPVKMRSFIRPKSISDFEAFEDFTFGNGQVEEGLKRRGTDIEDDEEGDYPEETVSRENPSVKNKEPGLPVIELNLDKLGAATATLTGLPKADTAKELLTEMEFMDPNGEIQTVSAKIPLWPSKYIIGIKPDSWASSKDNLKFQTAVVDLSGKPVVGARVSVDIFERKNYSHRKRLIGGFYAYENTDETKKIARFCEGITDAHGLLICEGKSPVSGNIILQAQSGDPDGNKTYANRDVWVADKSDWWFDISDNDRIDLLPEKKSYSPGEKAVFQVRMPFRSATALISVEREGVIDSWVSNISGKNPTIEVPVKPSYAPNVFISVLVVRGRVPGIKPSSMIDMGKPAYKLGIAGINVGWSAHELKVHVAAAQPVYKIRQKAQVKIKVTTAEGNAPPAGSEVAIAAVDEGLLELMPNASWNILAAMMGQRNYEVSTATAQMQVIGKRHFGLKALPPGGGGGAGKGTRELFDTLLLWKGKVTLDDQGEAAVEIPLNDSITGFRIVAVATGGTGLFGTGATSIRTTQDLMIFAGLPPLVREGDKYRAEFTLRNTTNRKIEADVTGAASGLSEAVSPISVTLDPSEAKVVGWDVTAPAGLEKLQWEVEIKEKGADQGDRIKVTQKITPVTPVRTYQATIMQVTKDINIEVERPHDAITGRGGVNVILKPKISDGLSGVTDYMKQYPYTCMEQKVSVAVALRDEALWKTVMAQLPSHLDSSGFIKYFPMCLYGSPTLTSYVLAISNEAGWEIPSYEKERMQTALKGFISGQYHGYSPLPSADLNIRKLAAIEALARYKQADASMLNSIIIEPNLWPTSAVIDWLNILHSVNDIPDSGKRIGEAEQILRSRLNFQGTKMGFATEHTDFLWWLMTSGDVNAVRLILTMKDSETWKEDMPRIVQGALARQRKGAWDLTLANAWGVLAMEKFSAKFEAVPVTGFSNAELGAKVRKTDWSANPKGTSHLYPWPAKKGTLEVTHRGTGAPWLTIQSLAAIPLKTDLSSGYKIKRTIIPVERKNPDTWTTGDILRVRLELEAQTDQTWVVVSDPVPAGASILGKGLARDSQILTQDEKRKGWVWPAFEERSFEFFRAYYEYVPKGSWTVEYTIRLNQTGTFHLPTTRVEAMYFPEMFGEIPNKGLVVQP